MRRKTTPISFRAPDDMLSRIDEERKPYGISRGDWVRGAISARLFVAKPGPDAAQIEELAQSVHRLEDEIATLKTNQARVLYILLTNPAAVDPETAEETVRSRLLK